MNDGGMAWWLWAILGLALAGLELAMPGGFYLLFFGIGALAVSLLAWGGLVQSLLPQLVLFSLFSIAATLLFRQRLVDRIRNSSPERSDSLVGETATAMQDIEPDGFGKVELRGTAWSARNLDSLSLARGSRCVVERVEGLLLWVRPA